MSVLFVARRVRTMQPAPSEATGIVVSDGRIVAVGEGTESLWSDFGHFRDLVTRLHLAGVNVAVHSIGDRGVREVLQLFTELRDVHGPRATHRIASSTSKRFRPMW